MQHSSFNSVKSRLSSWKHVQDVCLIKKYKSAKNTMVAAIIPLQICWNRIAITFSLTKSMFIEILRSSEVMYICWPKKVNSVHCVKVSYWWYCQTNCVFTLTEPRPRPMELRAEPNGFGLCLYLGAVWTPSYKSMQVIFNPSWFWPM